MLALVFAGAWGAGVLAAPPGPAAPVPAAAPVPRLVLLDDVLEPGVPGELAFALAGPGGAPVPAEDLQVTMARRDAAGVQHPPATPGPDGIWRAPLTLPAAGVWTAVVDVVPVGGARTVLTADLFAPGPFAPVPAVPSRVAQVGEYQVRLDGELRAGAPVFATVSRDGAPVTDLEPHLGAFGRLVALRRGDLAYAVLDADVPAPAAADRAGPGIAFTARLPGPGTYRLFLEFRHAGAVRTAEFVVEAG